MAHGEGRRYPARLARPRPCRPHRPIRAPRAEPSKRCCGRYGHAQHDAKHLQPAVDQQQFLHGHVYFHHGTVAVLGPFGLACDLGIPLQLPLRVVVAVGSHSTTTSPGRRDDVHGTKGAEAVAPGLADGRARGLEAYLWLVIALPREYRPRQPPTPALPSNPRRTARSAKTAWVAGPGASGLPARPCTAIPEGPRPSSLTAGVYHVPSPAARCSPPPRCITLGGKGRGAMATSSGERRSPASEGVSTRGRR